MPEMIGGVRIGDELAFNKFADTASTFKLKIRTRFGADVEVQILDSRGQSAGVERGLAVSMQTTGTLTDSERQAIANLADGFEAALQGIGAKEQQIDVAGLVKFDSKQLSSVELTYKPEVGMRSERSAFSLQVDSKRARIELKSAPGLPAANFSIESDRSPSAFLGDASQRQASVQRYLSQFDTTMSKVPTGTQAILQQVKDSFAQLNADEPARLASPAATTLRLADSGASLLTGLADFQARIDGDFSNGSTAGPMTVAGNFEYKMGQQTETRVGLSPADGRVTQTQSSDLFAKIIGSIGGNALDTTTGNYSIRFIENKTKSQVILDYAKGLLTQAKQVNSAQESDKWTLYQDFKPVAKSGEPRSVTSVIDLAPVAANQTPYQDGLPASRIEALTAKSPIMLALGETRSLA